MFRPLVCCVLMTAVLAAVPARADELVVLRSGAELVGTVSFDGGEVLIRINDSELRLPLAEIAKISKTDPAADTDSDRAEELLVSWLESQALKVTAESMDPGLLAEAYRLDPQNARIAFWYATGLVNNGNGKAAQLVLDAHKESIGKAYASLLPELSRRIALRSEIEQRPLRFVEAYDQLNEQLRLAADLPSDEMMMAAAFRVLDQNKEPVPQSALTLSGNDAKIEGYDDGWFLCSYMVHRTSTIRPLDMRVADHRYAPEKYGVSGGHTTIRDLPPFIASRRSEADQREVTLRTTDDQQSPVDEVSLSIRAAENYGGSSTLIELQTDSKGNAKSLLFPGEYVVTTVANGYVPLSKSFRVRGQKGGSDQIDLRLNKAIEGVVRVAWRVEGPDLEGPAGEQLATLDMRNGQLVRNSSPSTWLNIRQVRDELQFIVSDPRTMHMNRGMVGGGSWTRLVDSSFDEVDLNDADAYKSKGITPPTVAPSGIPNMHPYNSTPMYALETGRVYVGEAMMMQDHNASQAAMISYKFVLNPSVDDALKSK